MISGLERHIGTSGLSPLHIMIGRNGYQLSGQDDNTLEWDPTDWTIYDPVNGADGRAWHHIGSNLVSLGHELAHMYDDICRGRFESCGRDQSETYAMQAENRLRHSLYLLDPSCSNVMPRPGYQAWFPDLLSTPRRPFGEGDVAESWQLWQANGGMVCFGNAPQGFSNP
jgi:hypothetical protein